MDNSSKVDKTFKVLMMGGRRCGKTSALASMFDQLENDVQFIGDINVYDKTILETKKLSDGKEEKQEKLANKTKELKNFINTSDFRGVPFIIDKGPTRHFWDYKMRIKLSEKKKTMDIVFRDSAGEFFDYGGGHTEETEEYLKNCHVFVVVVDVPYLMSDNVAVAEAANVTDSIKTFITQIDGDTESQDEATAVKGAKMVLFVPIKCEKWVHEGCIDKVNDKIKELYKSTFAELAKQNAEVSIIPIETVGGLELHELQAPHILITSNEELIEKFGSTDENGNKPERVSIRCKKLTSKTVYLENGQDYTLNEGDKVNKDPNGVFTFDGEILDIVRPVCWFKHSSANPEYSPKNCEQITLHIMRFLLKKFRKERTFWEKVSDWWNGVDFEEYIQSLEDSDILKKDGQVGIVEIQKSMLN